MHQEVKALLQMRLHDEITYEVIKRILHNIRKNKTTIQYY